MTQVWGPELKYMPELWSEWLEVAVVLILALIAVMFIHFILRMVLAKHKYTAESKLFLYPLPVRFWHWTNAVLVIGLLCTGILGHFDIGPVKIFVLIHKVFGLIFVCAWAFFALLNVTTDNGKNYQINFNGLIGRMFKQAGFYAYGILKGEPHPFAPTVSNKFNPLQQLTYVGVVYILMPVILVTGLISLFPSIFGKHQALLTVHFVCAAIALLFVLGHVYLCTTGAYLTQIVKGMLDGYSRHEKH